MEVNPTTTDSISNDGKPPPSNKTKAQSSASSKKNRKTKPKAPAAEAPRRDPSPTAAVDQSSRLSNLREQASSQPPPPPPPPPHSRFTAHLQPYPGPPYPVPPYPMNGNPYHSSPSPFHQPPNPGTPVNGQNPHVGPGIPGHPAYPYPVHSGYGPHGYPSYPQYPPAGMMMYGSPGPSQVDPTRPQEAPGGSPAAQSTTDSGTDMARNGSQGTAAGSQPEAKKRTKTQRACDSCRSRKIRCDVLPDTEPPVCQHCKQYGFECTFFLPITETRFKKKKLEEEAAAAAAAAAEKDREAERSTHSPHAEQAKPPDPKVYGPTSAPYMLHSSAMISSRTYETYDMRYHHTWDVSARGDGVIQVNEPHQSELHLSHPKPFTLQLERDVVEKLVNAFFTEVAPMLPVITQEEFVASSPPPPILLHSICLVAATRREVPQQIFDSLRHAVNSIIKMEDVLSTASIVNIQSLLILAMSGDCHSQSVPTALSALWIRLGCAIRMAQDLGLHRAESVKQNIELRRRLWGICVVSDRWISLTYGHPFMIDVRDCDARLPSSGDPHDLYMDELVRLSVILGRVQKAIYTPAGLTITNDGELETLLADLESWKVGLPENLQFRGPESPRSAGILFMFYSCVNMIFWRVFMRISYSCPAHLKFHLTVEKWTRLVRLTGDAIDWLDANEAMYDVWLLVAYCATSCALVQYHTWARRRDTEAQAKLKKLRDCIRKWEASISPDHMSARRKTAEIIALLYEATQGPQHPLEAPALNPTGGVKVKPPLGGLVFKKDPTRPGGGVFIAEEKHQELLKDVPGGVIVTKGGTENETEGEATMTAVSNVRTTNDDPSMSHTPDLSSTTSMAASTWSTGGTGSGPPPVAHGNPMVNFAPLAPGYPNMNPALNPGGGTGDVRIMNTLDQHSNLENFAIADSVLEGIPGSMFDWGQWDNFFSRFGPNVALFQQQQQQQQQAAMANNSPQQNQPQQGQYQYGT